MDFDNTIVSYDAIMHKVALEQGWIEPQLQKSKKQIQDHIRLTSDGERKWQQLQAIVYGQRIRKAQLMEGVLDFLQSCTKHEIKVYIISHKTRYSNLGESKDDLRVAALDFMRQNGFFDENLLNLPVDSVYFESTREEKVSRIETLHCTHFIDDLEEIFLEKSFPKTVEKFLYDPYQWYTPSSELRIVKHWGEIYEYFFKT